MSGIEGMIDASGCSPRSLSDLELTRILFDEIVRELDLHPVGETQWHQFPGTGGITGLCLLAEFHLACHTFPEHGSMCLNLFCCVPRSEWNFQGVLERLFEARTVTIRQLARIYVQPHELAANR
jgi:S-adenosylmethionine decarboxylase